MPWLILFLAGLFEIAGALGLRYTAGFTKLWPTVMTLAGFAGSLGLLTLSVKSLPLGTAYAVWTAMGTVGTVIAGIYLFNEPTTVARLACIAVIIAGTVGLKFVSPG